MSVLAIVPMNEDMKTSQRMKTQTISSLSNKHMWHVNKPNNEAVELASYQTDKRSEVAFRQFPKRTVVATGYTAGYESTGKTEDHPQYGVTYSGLPVQRGDISTIAADLTEFPLGTVLYIPDYGYGIVTDIGGAIEGNKIDLYYEEVEDVYREWGKREVDVYVIEKGEGSVTASDIQAWEQAITDESIPVMNTN
ncbi:3D (Asp-Asp-Asp) domain-containing protein [Alkalibacillus flavidus]|uniref:3D (Asp-Asp-Asp) domain-containing protein n=1 Tax=Alkalibacillus flavidus TaxID=546021 RepID=A0ABV2KWZ7_9BACI